MPNAAWDGLVLIFSREFAGVCTRLGVWRAVASPSMIIVGTVIIGPRFGTIPVVSLDVNPRRFMADLLHVLNIRSRIHLRRAVSAAFAAQFQNART
jgi:hypothetical protein